MSVTIPPRTQALAAPAAGPAGPTPAWGKAGPVGLGAGVLQTEFPLFALGNSPQHRMRRAWQLGQSVAYVFAAERTISGKLSTMGPTQEAGEVGWHLEDPDGERIDDQYPDPVARAAFQLLDKPMGALTLEEAGGMRLTRRQLWDVSSRHMGLCGQGAWVLDQLDGWGWPRAILYCRPDRLSPEVGPGGVLAGWRLDKGAPQNPNGTLLELEEVALLYLQAPDEGWFSTGLVEAALVKAQLNGSVDKFFAQMLSGGGRLSGLLAPRQGILDEQQYQQTVRDWRNITEQPEAAKRLQVLRAPVEFTRTVGTPAEMGLTELMTRNRDDLLALWGVPYSQLGGSPAAGMGMGEARDSDRQALYENACMPRGAELEETIQDILDRLLPVLGWAPRFVWDWPDLVPQATKYDQAQKAANVPLKNSERRAILGLQPFGPKVLGTTGAPLDDEVWVPMTIQPVQGAVEGEAMVPEAPEPPPQLLAPQAGPEGETPEEAQGEELEGEESEAGAVAGGKARLRPQSAGARVVPGVAQLRSKVERKVTPELKRSVAATLKDQASQVAARVRSKWSSIKDAPKDDSLWWGRKGSKDRERPWDAPLLQALKPALTGVGQVVSSHIHEQLGGTAAAGKAGTGPADQRAIDWALRYGSGRITRINDWTRAEVRKLIAEAIEQGLSPLEAGDLVEGWSGWDEYRAERIARTELMFAYNAAALDTYAEYAVTQVEALDGDEDEECAARNGQVYDLPDAAAIMDHPNGTLDWAPIFAPGG